MLWEEIYWHLCFPIDQVLKIYMRIYMSAIVIPLKVALLAEPIQS